MFRLAVPLALTIGLFAAHAGFAVIHVPADQPTIQAALNVAPNGETIVVAPGTYNEHDLDFHGKDLILRSSGGPQATVIDGGAAGPVFVLDNGESRAAVIEGFTVTNGFGAANFEGGGLLISNGSSPTIRGNWIVDNDAAVAGGGIKVDSGANPLIDGNVIADNTASEQGGGIHVIQASATIVGNEISGNVVSGMGAATPPGGGGVKITLSTDVVIRLNVIAQNSAPFTGGGISIFGSDAEVNLNEVVGNSADNGGGIHLESQVSNGGNRNVVLSSNLIEANTAQVNGGGIHSFFEGTASAIEILGNSIVANRCIEPACADVNGSGCCKGGGISAIGGIGPAGHVVRDNLLLDNEADLYGGAIFDNAGAFPASMFLTFEDNEVRDNFARFNYPGIACIQTQLCRIERSTFSANRTLPEPANHDVIRNPGAIFMAGNQSASVINSIFFENFGSNAGALLVTGGATETLLLNNTFADNVTGSTRGGTVRLDSDAEVVHNIFDGDHHAIRVLGPPTLDIRTNDFHDQSVGIMTGGPEHATVASLNSETWASGNLAVNPLFLSQANDLYLLTPGSPLLGAAACGSSPLVDNAGDPRPVGNGCDVGADELHVDTVGLYSPQHSKFFLRAIHAGGAADATFVYGTVGAGWTPLTGDWNDDEVDTPGLYDPSTSRFRLRNSNSAGAVDLFVTYGPAGAGWVPLVGDWDGDGDDTVGLYDPVRSRFLLRNRNSGGAADLAFVYGPAGSGWVPLAGDWDGDGDDTIGLYDPSRGRFFLRNSNSAGAADFDFRFGPEGAGWTALTGDWDGDRQDGVGLYDTSRSLFFLKNVPAGGVADQTFGFGPQNAGWTPLGGRWGL